VSSTPTPVSLGRKPAPGRLAVTGIGNALLDIIAQDHDATHARLGLALGSMTLVAEDRLDELFNAMGPTMQTSGGSAANTIAGVAALGGTCGFVGKIADDDFGQRFRHDLTALGVEADLTLVPASDGATGRCHVFVTPDAQRTMATYLGVGNQFEPDDVTDTLIQRSEITYVEGYLFDLAPAKAAIRAIVEYAHQHDSLVAFTLSDSFCVERHRADILELVVNDVDVLLGNEAEITSLFQCDLDAAYQHLAEVGVLTFITRGSDGSDIVGMSETIHVPAAPVAEVVDTNGAGDLFAAGVLYGLALGLDPVEAANLGALCAAEVITHYGARPESDLELAAIEAGLL
jgi:sugar/nucleoside kinase (ribokinase family)